MSDSPTRSPFLTPSRRRRRRDALRRRRRRRMQLGAAATVAVLALAVAMTLARSGERHGTASAASHRGSSAARSGGSRPSGSESAGGSTASGGAGYVTPTHSQTGLPLGRPPLALSLGAADDPVHLAFAHPPRGGLLFDLDSGRVLWQHDAHARMRIASLTKMMTALLTVLHSRPDERVLVTKQAVDSAGSKVGVLPLGHHVRLETMLYGLLLPSGNDAAIALAQHEAGSIPAFVAQMNAEAARLGMGCTRYSSPSGYVDQGNYSCAADLAVLAHVDEQQPRLARIVRTFRAELPFPIKGGKLFLYNNNPLLRYAYPGASGLKTGFTAAAGKCLVATAARDGVHLGVVLLDAHNPATQARQLLDRGFEGVHHLPRVHEPAIPASE